MKKKSISIKSNDLKLFARIIQSGISPSEALEYMSKRQGKRKEADFRYLKDRLQQGINFSEILSETSIAKNPFYINMLRSAESTGNIPEILNQIAINIDNSKAIKNQIIGILIYPAIVITMILVLTLALLIFIVPNIIPVISMNNDHLPAVTKVLVILSKFIRTEWLKVIYVFSALIIFVMTIFNISTFRIIFEKILLRIPLLKNFLNSYISLGYSMTIYQSISYSSNISGIFKELSIIARSRIFKKEFQKIYQKIEEGKLLQHAIAESKYIPQIWVMFIAVAEQSSSYAEMFKNLYEYYRESFDQSTKVIMRLAEPVLMIVIGLIVGVLAYGIMAPLYGIMNNLK